MKLKLIPDPTFKTIVNIHVAGEKQKGQIEITYRALSLPELKKYFDKAAKEKADYFETIKGLIVGWNLEEPFTPENLKIFTDNYHTAAITLLETYTQELTNSRAGN